MLLYLNWMEDGLQHGENIAEEEVPGLSQRVEQLLTCISRRTHYTSIKHTVDSNVIQRLSCGTFIESDFVPEDDHAFCEQLVLWVKR